MNLLLTGRPGVGKTTLIQKVCSRLVNVRTSGFYTSEIREGGQRLGFKIVTLDGLEGTLAHIQFKGPQRVGRYGVDLRPLDELAVPRIAPQTAEADLIVIDEIGKMECFSETFRRAVLAALDSPISVLATLAKGGHEFIKAVAQRKDVRMTEINLENRDSLAEELVKLIAQAQ